MNNRKKKIILVPENAVWIERNIEKDAIVILRESVHSSVQLDEFSIDGAEY